jgi:hypothetical protein
MMIGGFMLWIIEKRYPDGKLDFSLPQPEAFGLRPDCLRT